MPSYIPQTAFWVLLLPTIVMAVLLGLGFRYVQRPDLRLIAQLNEATRSFGEAVQHHVDVNAILAMTTQFRDKPHLLDELAGYSRQAVGATLLYRVNSLSSRLKAVQDKMNQIGAQAAQYLHYKTEYDKLKVMETNLLNELSTADKAVQSFRAGLQSV